MMRDLIPLLAGASSLLLAATAHASVSVDPGSARKVCQLTGEFDRETGARTLNATETRFGFWGTDLGTSFEHEGRLYFLFGDTHAKAGVTRAPDADLIAVTDDRDPERCLRLDMNRQADGAYAPLTVPGVSARAFEVPTGGVSANGRMYVFTSTDNSPTRAMGRSVLSASQDNGASFQRLYDFSTTKFINVAAARAASLPGLPVEGSAVLLWGSGEYRASSPHLAVVPEAGIEDAGARRFFAGLVDGAPTWSAAEADAVPLFDQPCLGEISVAWEPTLGKWLMLYNCAQPGGRSRIEMRTADAPWGPWAEARTLFDPAVDGDCRFIRAAQPGPGCPQAGDPHSTHAGDAYGAYLIPGFGRPDGQGGVQVYFTLSTWNPYNVVLMRATLRPDAAAGM